MRGALNGKVSQKVLGTSICSIKIADSALRLCGLLDRMRLGGLEVAYLTINTTILGFSPFVPFVPMALLIHATCSMLPCYHVMCDVPLDGAAISSYRVRYCLLVICMILA